ncbi:hypothetical protein ACFX13_013799 [Malus domestica]
MIPTESQGKRKLYSFPDGKTYGIQLPVPCNSKRYCSSSNACGWLATMDVLDRGGLIIALVNPFRKEAAPIRLPRLDFNVLPIYRHVSELAFTRGGQKYWIYSKRSRGCLLTDAIFHKGQVYAVGKWGNILSFDVNSKPIEAKMLNPQEYPFPVYAEKAYLVESTKGELLHVR